MRNKPRIEGFELLDCLGEGGMAIVWKARQLSLDRLVAIKVLAPRLAMDPGDVERFDGEAKAAARLKHPGIVQVYDAGISGGSYYFVMELIDGYTTGDWLRRKGCLDEDQVLVLAECIASALDYAWTTFGMVHCDIKPDNVMVDADGSVKIADLGLANVVSDMAVALGTDEVMGTPAYMAPEQAIGEKDLDCRVDIYALGAMLYHLVTGRMLFDGETEDRVMELQVHGTACGLKELRPELSPWMCALIERFLAKDKQDRPADWKVVLRDLRLVKRRQPLPAPSREWTSTVARSSTRGKTLVSSAVRPSGVHAPSLAPRSSRMCPLIILGGMAALALVVIIRWNSFSNAPHFTGTPVVASPPRTERSGVDERDLAANRQLARARVWAQAHPGDYRGAAAQYRTVAELYPGTTAAFRALTFAGENEALFARTVEQLMIGLDAAARARIAVGDFEGAEAVYRDYRGMLSPETRAVRQQRLNDLLGSALDDAPEGAHAEETRDDPITAILSLALHEGIDAACEAIEVEVRRSDIVEVSPDLNALRELLQAAQRVERSILISFGDDVDGEPRTITLRDATVEGFVRDVDLELGRVRIESTAGDWYTLGIEDLALRERLARMDGEDQAALALVKGLLARQFEAHDYARRFFQRLPEAFGDVLCRIGLPPP